MRIALISDIHANLPRSTPALRGRRNWGMDRLASSAISSAMARTLGTAVVETCLAAGERGAIAVLGKHDLAVLKPRADMNRQSRSDRWTRSQLSESENPFLPAPLRGEVRRALFVHADASESAAWHYVTDAEAARASLAGCLRL